MENKNKLVIVSVIILIAFIGILIGVLVPKNNNSNKDVLNSYKQSLNYNEGIEKIDNPDQGFYRPIYVELNETGITYDKSIINNQTQLYHLRIDISAFSKIVNTIEDKPFTQEALNGLEELLSYVKQNNKNAIVRFAYDKGFNGNKNSEPSLDIIKTHIEQFCKVLNNYEDTITALETGLIGPWGEMHASSIANKNYINPIIETILSNTNNICVLVRTPKMIYDYLEISLSDIANYEIKKEDKTYRLGIYNDGYLGSDSDLGTFTDRGKEIDFLSKQTNHLPYGGEVVVPDSSLHNIDVCLPEMNKINLSYLNLEWNNLVIDKWKNSSYTSTCGNNEIYYNQTAFTYIQNHMGYRFVLRNSVFEYSNKFDELNIKLNIENVGFGNLNKIKQAKVIFVSENGDVKFTKNVGNFSGNVDTNYSLNMNLENGKYQVYLCLYANEVDNINMYSLAFANKEIWNENLKANKIGEIDINR